MADATLPTTAAHPETAEGRPALFLRGDLDAFFGLFLNNLIDVLLITNLCLFVLGFSEALVFEKILPGIALGVLIGNAWFCREAWKARVADPACGACALPYGINLVPILLFTFYVMLPAQQLALAAGLSAAEANEVAWLSGVMGCVLSGLAELLAAACLPALQRWMPVSAMLTALGVAGLLFIGADYFFRSYQHPLVGLPVLFVMIYLYAGKVPLRFGMSSGVVILLLGLLLAYGTHALGLPGPVDAMADVSFRPGLYLPGFALADALPYLGDVLGYADVLIPIGVFSTFASLVTLHAAKAAGDDYSVPGALVTNGIGSIAAGIFGSPYATTVYIGHVAWKAVGAGHAYSLASGGAIALLCMTGSFALVTRYVPMEAGMAILVWVGVSVCAQAVSTVPRRYAIALTLGLLPGVAAFSGSMIRRVLGSAGYGTPEQPYTEALFERMAAGNTFTDGIFALEQGWMLTSLLITAVAAACIDRDLKRTLAWIAIGALCALLGVSSHFEVVSTDVVARLGPAWTWVCAYLLAGAAVALVHFTLARPSPKAR